MNISDRMVLYLENHNLVVSQFEREMNWSNGYIRSAKNPASDKLLQFKNRFPKLNLDWLMRGVGEMEGEASFIEQEEKEIMPVISTTSGQPYYNVDFQGGFDVIMNDQTINPDYLIDFAPYNKDGVVWCNVIGHSMDPEIKNGSIIAIKEIANWLDFLALGEIYAIVTKNEQRMIKRLRKGSSDDSYTMISTNSDYEPQEIKKSMITRIFAVLGTSQRLS